MSLIEFPEGEFHAAGVQRLDDEYRLRLVPVFEIVTAPMLHVLSARTSGNAPGCTLASLDANSDAFATATA